MTLPVFFVRGRFSESRECENIKRKQQIDKRVPVMRVYLANLSKQGFERFCRILKNIGFLGDFWYNRKMIQTFR